MSIPLPYFWPDPRKDYQSSSLRSDWQVPFAVRKILGVTSNLDNRGIERIKADLAKKQAFRLIVGLYPGCKTRREHLQSLLSLQDSLGEQFLVRLMLFGLLPVPGTSIVFCGDSVTETCMLTGPVSNLGMSEIEVGHLNMLLSPDARLLEMWYTWFDATWSNAYPLNTESVNIPRLVPPPGSDEGMRRWEAYVGRCRAVAAAKATATPATVEANKPAIGSEQKESSVSRDLGAPRLDPLVSDIMDMYSKGSLATFVESSRVGPLELPVKPEWLDVPSLKRVWHATRRISCTVSILNKEDTRKIEHFRKSAGDILRRLSYTLGNAQRWIPDTAISLFEKELERANKEGMAGLHACVGNSVDAFLEHRRDDIFLSLSALYQEFHPGRRLPDSALQEVIASAKARLDGIFSGNLLPKVSYAKVQFRPQYETKWRTDWGQALTLLNSIAVYPRKLIVDPFALRGLNVRSWELLEAMNILDDRIVSIWRANGEKTKWQAQKELGIIDEIVGCKMKTREKCAQLLKLIRGNLQLSVQRA